MSVCIGCGEDGSRVLETRMWEDGWRRRRRLCRCGEEFWTVEVPVVNLTVEEGGGDDEVGRE